MASLLVTTPGAADANSYASYVEYQAYAATRLPAIDDAASAIQGDAEAALIMAARSLDANFDWTGAPVDDVQVLCWPRAGMASRTGFPVATTVNPQPLKNAQCELAYQLLGGADLISDNSAAINGVSSVKAGSVAVSFQSVNTATRESMDMIIRRMGSAFNYVSVAIPGEVRRLLVPSWFKQHRILLPVIFDVYGGAERGPWMRRERE